MLLTWVYRAERRDAEGMDKLIVTGKNPTRLLRERV
jgi:hypothetical protein